LRRSPIRNVRGNALSRALRSHALWLTMAYVALLLLLARAYV
jgi:hypothetical protein